MIKFNSLAFKLFGNILLFLITSFAWGQADYNLIKNVDQLEVGAKYIIVGKRTNGSFFVLNTQSSNNRSATALTTEVSGETITLSSGFREITLGGSTGAWTFQDLLESSGFLFAASSSQNYLRTQTTNNANGQWSIDINATTGLANVVAQGTSSRNVMQMNTSSALISCYSSASQAPVYFYKKVVGIPPTDVVTGTVANITAVSADFESNSVGTDGGSAITERGVVYATTANPTISDNKVVVAGTTGIFDASLAGLANSTTYNVRAFATNAAGTTYGSNVSFTTNAPAGNSNSDLIINNGFTYPENIDYTLYQGTTLTTGNSIEIAQFILRDGGSANDADELATSLTAIGFDVSNAAMLRKVGLFDGTTLISQADAADPLNFSGLSITSNDNSTKTFSLRVSFLTTVTDNAQFTFTVNSVSPEAGKSLFAAANGGGATTSTAVNDNTIEVTATQLVFDVQPSNSNINVAMSPAVQVSTRDANGNLDLDTASVTITSTGTLTGTTTANTTNGIATFSNLLHTATDTGRALTATSGALSQQSNTFNIIEGPCFDGQAVNTGIFTSTGTTILATSSTALRLASAANPGSITTAPLAGVSGNVTFRAEARGWTASENTFTVNLGGVEGTGTVVSTFANSDTNSSFEWVEVVLNGVPTSPVLSISCTAGKRVTFRSIELFCEPSEPTPQISVSQGASNIPSGSGNYNFGNQLVNSSSSAVSFIISNVGDADLTLGTIALSGAQANQFSINTSATSATVSESGSTEFTITFSPTSLGSKTATIAIPNNAGSDYTFTISGNGTNSALSNIIETSGFTYTSNIVYTTFQSATITSTGSGAGGSVGVFQFNVQDGGGSADADELATTLNTLDFTYTGTSNTIRAAALFQGNGKLADASVTANGISFTGLNIEASDDGNSPNITLRVTFNTTVTDNQQLQFTISSATANVSGSVFASANAGGATSSITDDRNRIEVTADRLAFTTQPSGQNVDVNLASFTISAVDTNNNVDLDYSSPNEIALTTSGTDLTSSSPYVFNNGQINISDVSFSTAQNDINLVATGAGLAFSNIATSNNFNISAIIIVPGSYRTTSAGTWPNSGTATWERFVTGNWQTNAAPGANSTDVLIIRHNITTNAAFAASGGVGTKLTVAENGTFNAGHNCTFSELAIQENGVFSVNVPAVDIIATTGNLVVESGGKLIINSATLNNADGLWEGIENFKDGSILEIQNWDWDSSTGEERLIDSANGISTNAQGYYFGNIYFNANPGTEKAFTLVGIDGNHKLCQNDLIINNASSARNVILTNRNSNVEIGGSVIAQQNTFAFGSIGSSQLTHTVKGDILGQGGIINLNQQSAGLATVFVSLEGNMNILAGSTLNSSDDGCKIIFNGIDLQPQTLSIAGTLGTFVDFEIAAGAEVQLVNQDFDLTNASNDFDVLSGGTIHFNYLNVLGSGRFAQAAGGILKITSADGVNTTGNNIGNVQNTGTRTYSQTGHFHYVGNVTPQLTGNVMTSGSTAKRIVVDKDNETDIVNLSQSTGTSNQLYIKKGIFNESVTSFITGSGTLQMDLGSAYRMYVLETTLPQLSGAYTINEGASVELLGSGNQVLRGGRAYYDLVFGNGSVKTISSAISTIDGEVLIDENTILDVQVSTFGGSSTVLVMDANSRFINGGSSTRPNMGGVYLLDETSTIEFTGVAATVIRTFNKSYANVDISGTNVTLSGNTTLMNFLPNATFTVKDGGVFNVKNDNGLSGANNTAITNTNNPLVVLEPNSKIAYIHTGDQTVTSEVEYAKLDLLGSGVKTLNNNTIVNEDLIVNESAEVLLPTTRTLTVNGKIEKSNNEDFVIESGANLLQSNAQTTNTNVGVLKVQRATSLIRRGDVTIWSAPVANQNLLAFSPETLTNRFYTHDEETNQFVNVTPSTNVFITGKGYGIRARNTLLSTDPMENWLGTFTGVPNNGDYSFAVAKTPNPSQDPLAYDPTGFNMIGNPYPSALNLLDFYNENNTLIQNKFYLYEHTLPSNTPSGDISKTNYGVLSVGTPSIYAPATQTNLSNPADIDPYTPVIQAGQGFFVSALNNGNVTFKNAMRENTSGNFFRANQVASNGLDMFRLKLTAPDQFSNQTVIGFFETTSDGLDVTDTKGFNGSPLYSILENDKFIIQARSYPLEQSTVIPIGFHAGVSGSHTLALHQPEGIFVENQYVLLHDLLLGVYHNLSLSPYTFEVSNGTHDNRFEVLFSEVLSNENPTFEAQQLITFSQVNEINVQLKGDSLMQKIMIYDISGRLIYEAKEVQSKEVKITNLTPTNTVLMVKVTNEEGKIFTTKLFF